MVHTLAKVATAHSSIVSQDIISFDCQFTDRSLSIHALFIYNLHRARYFCHRKHAWNFLFLRVTINEWLNTTDTDAHVERELGAAQQDMTTTDPIQVTPSENEYHIIESNSYVLIIIPKI